MTGVVIDPKDLGQQEQAVQQQPTTSSGQGVVVDPSMLGAATVTPPPTAQSPSGFYQGATDPLYAVGQILAKGLEQLPEGAKLGRYPIAASAKAFAENVVPSREAEYQRQRQAAGADGLDYGRFAGGVASSLVPGTIIAKGAGLVAPASRLAQSAITGGVSSGLMTPVESSTDFGANKAQQVLLGMGMGPLVDKTMGAVVSPAVQAGTQAMRDLGVKLTPGQAFGGLTQTLEQGLAKLPIIGANARSAIENSLQGFDTGVINSTLSKIGDALPEGKTGRDAIQYLSTKVNQAYEDILPKVTLGNTLNLYKGLGDTVNSFSTPVKEHADYLANFIKTRITEPLSKGDLSGREFKNIDTELGKKITAYSKGGGADSELADALKQVQNTLRTELRAINPKDAPALDAANAAWADKIRIERAAGYLSAEQGVFNPSQFSAAVKASDTSARKGAFGRGEARMQDIADAAMNTIGSKGVPTTMAPISAELAVPAALGTGMYGGLVNPAIPAAAAAAGLAGAGLYTRPGMSAFNALMLSGRPSMAPAARQALPAIAAPQMTGGLLRDPEGRYVIPINGVGQRQ